MPREASLQNLSGSLILRGSCLRKTNTVGLHRTVTDRRYRLHPLASPPHKEDASPLVLRFGVPPFFCGVLDQEPKSISSKQRTPSQTIQPLQTAASQLFSNRIKEQTNDAKLARFDAKRQPSQWSRFSERQSSLQKIFVSTHPPIKPAAVFDHTRASFADVVRARIAILLLTPPSIRWTQ